MFTGAFSNSHSQSPIDSWQVPPYTLQSRLSQNQVDFTLMASPSHVAQWSFNNTFFIPQNLVQIPAQLQFNLYPIGDPILNEISYAIAI